MSSVLNTAVSIVRTKVFAVFLGPFGMGVFSQLNTLLNLATNFVSLGMATGTVKYVAEYNADQKVQQIRHLLQTTMGFLGLFSLVVLAASQLFASEIAALFFNDPTLTLILAVALFNIPFMVLANQVNSLLQGLKQVKIFVLVGIAGSLLSLAVAVPLVILWGLKGMALYLAAFGLIQFTVVHVGLRRVRMPKDKLGYLPYTFDRSILRNLLPYGIATVLVTILWLLTDLAIRTVIIRRLGIDQNGIYQAVAGLATQYWSILVGFFWLYAYPRICELVHDAKKMDLELNQIFRFQILFLIPILAAFLSFRYWIIPLFYSEAFMKATDLVFFQATGDLFKCTLWVLGLPLMALGRLRLWVLLNFGLNSAHLLIFFFFLPTLGLTSVVVGFAGSQFLFFLITYGVLSRMIGLRLAGRNWLLILTSALLLVLLGYVLRPGLPLLVGGPLLTVGWACLVFRKEEFLALGSILRRKDVSSEETG